MPDNNIEQADKPTTIEVALSVIRASMRESKMRMYCCEYVPDDAGVIWKVRINGVDATKKQMKDAGFDNEMIGTILKARLARRMKALERARQKEAAAKRKLEGV